MGWKEYLEQNCANYKNFVLLGEAGSGKSEIALNLAAHLAQCQPLPVHFFDLDMTKPLFRSRDLAEEMETLGVHFHFEKQFMDAPTQVGGVNRLLGLALGLCTGALDCWLLALVLWFLVNVTAGGLDWLNTAVLQRSVGYSLFGAFTPFLLHY